MRSLVIAIVGSGDDGVVASGELILGAFTQEGYYGMMCTRSGTSVRGDELSCGLRVSTLPVLSPAGSPDLAVVHNWEDFRRLRGKLHVDGDTVFVYEQRTGIDPSAIPLGDLKPAAAVPVPIEELAEKASGLPWAKGQVVAGLLAGWLGLPVRRIQEGIVTRSGRSEDDMQRRRGQAFAAGAAYAKLHPLAGCPMIDKPPAGNRLRPHYCDLLNIV